MYEDEHEELEIEAWIRANEEYPVLPWIKDELEGELWE